VKDWAIIEHRRRVLITFSLKIPKEIWAMQKEKKEEKIHAKEHDPKKVHAKKHEKKKER
jgi:hypothetical protein